MIKNRLFLFILFSFVLKLFLARWIPLSADEAYYWVWSQHLQWSYFDHPAMIAWIFSVANKLSFSQEWIRLPGLMFSYLGFFFWYKSFRRYLNQDQLFYWSVLYLVSPLTGIGGFLHTPDLPLMVFYGSSFYFLTQILSRQKAIDYLGLGISLGLGFSSKYHIVLFVLCAVILLTITKQWVAIRWKYVPLVLMTGLLGSFPVLYWNLQNHFESFHFQLQHGLGNKSWKPFWTLSYFPGQLLAVFPSYVYFSFFSEKNSKTKTLLCFAWVPLLFFFLTSFRGHVEVNWPIIAYPFIYALAVLGLEKKFTYISKRFAGWFWSPVIVWMGIILALLLNSFFHFLPKSKLSEPFYFRPLISVFDRYEHLYASTYQMASYLWFYRQAPVYKLESMSRFDFYDTLPEARPEKLPFYILMDQASELCPPWNEKEYNKEVIEQIGKNFYVLKVSK